MWHCIHIGFAAVINRFNVFSYPFIGGKILLANGLPVQKKSLLHVLLKEQTINGQSADKG
jgi:hypothetical protein